MKKIFTLLGIGFISFLSNGQVATHLHFDGINDRVVIANESNFDFTTNMTVEFMINSTSFDLFDGLVTKGDNSWRVHTLSTGEISFAASGAFTDFNSTTQVNDGFWHHVAVTYDGVDAKIYIDGSMENSVSATNPINNGNYAVAIGNNLQFLSRAFGGNMDEVRIWNIARTATEINDNKDYQLTGTETGLVSYFQFNQGISAGSNPTETSLTDAASTNNGTLINFALTGISSNWLGGSPVLSCVVIADQTVSITDSELCPTNTGTTVTTGSSQSTLNYYLRDNTNDTIVDGPISGTGSGLNFNTGSLNSSMTYNVYATNSGNALNLDGTNDHVVLPNESDYDFTTNMTVEFMIQTTNLQSTDGLVTKGDNSWRIHGSSSISGNVMFAGAGAFGDFHSTSSVNDGIWHHVAVTYDGINAKMYIDGVLENSISATNPISNTSFDVALGENLEQTGRFFDGNMDEVRIWNVARTSTQINANMDTELQGNEVGLVSYYNFNQGIAGGDNTAITVLNDNTGNGNDGAFTGINLNGATSNLVIGSSIIECNLELSSTVSVTVQDIVDPVTPTLTSVTIDCNGTLTTPSTTDACEGTINGTTTGTLSFVEGGSTTITWTFNDGNGNSTTADQVYNYDDSTDPVNNVASLTTLTDQCSVPLPTAPTATDACAGAITGTTTTTFPMTASGTITWTYDDGNGNVITQDQTVTITDNTAPVADATTLADITETCEVASLTAPTATDNCAGTVTVTNDAILPITTIGTTVVTWTYDDGNGNTSTQTQNVIVSDPMIDITTTTTNFVITANNSTATSYQWIDCNNANAAISGETNATYSATVNGDFAVIVTEGSCSDTSDCVTIAGLGIDNATNFGVTIHPNPNNGQFYVNSSKNNVTITIYSVDGKIIVSNLKITEANQLISLGNIESGVYFVKVSNSTNQKTIRLVIE